MRLTVALIIGSVALAAILGFILQPCLFPDRMIVYATPNVYEYDGTPFSIEITVKNHHGSPIKDAQVQMIGLDLVEFDATDQTGTVTFSGLEPDFEGHLEGYLDIHVKAPCYQTFDQEDMIKIIAVPP